MPDIVLTDIEMPEAYGARTRAVHPVIDAAEVNREVDQTRIAVSERIEDLYLDVRMYIHCGGAVVTAGQIDVVDEHADANTPVGGAQ